MSSFSTPGLVLTGPVTYQGDTYPGVATAEDYGRYMAAAVDFARAARLLGWTPETSDGHARFAADAMNACHADDTEFIADDATVTAYVHSEPHMSATFEGPAATAFVPDESRPYPGEST
jgi:hypothetical protein